MALPPSRSFNTSRSLKAVHDSSTIDFAYFPDMDPDAEGPAPSYNVPMLPQSVLRGRAAEEGGVAAEAVATDGEVGEPSVIVKPMLDRIII
jgi:hypothetical protein